MATNIFVYSRRLILLLLFISSFAQAQRAVPELWGMRVHDDAKVLSTQYLGNLEAMLKQYEDSTSNQIAILIINSLENESIEEYSLRVAEKWQLGQKEKDNGVLLLIAIDDRKMRIEVGEGLEGVLPDAICNRIIRDEMAPNFRRNDYEAGITAAVNAMTAAIAGEYVADAGEDGLGDLNTLGWKEKILIGLFVFGILGIFTFMGIFIKGCAGWFMYAFLIPFYATFPMVILGVDGGLTALGIYAIGFPILKLLLGNSAWGQKFSKRMQSSGGRSGGGWSSGSGWFGGGGGGGGWSGGGGFSGGGGGFSGGGSSGSW